MGDDAKFEAARRRELRRQKILAGQETRIKKIMGFNNKPEVPPDLITPGSDKIHLEEPSMQTVRPGINRRETRGSVEISPNILQRRPSASTARPMMNPAIDSNGDEKNDPEFFANRPRAVKFPEAQGLQTGKPEDIFGRRRSADMRHGTAINRRQSSDTTTNIQRADTAFTRHMTTEEIISQANARKNSTNRGGGHYDQYETVRPYGTNQNYTDAQIQGQYMTDDRMNQTNNTTFTDPTNPGLLLTSEAQRQHQQQPTVENSRFTKFRHIVCLLLGILVRISFLFAFGRDYVQTLFNPFVALEIALLGYQKAVNMDLTTGMKGGLWLSALVISGVKPEVIQSYKTLMSVVTNVADDFTLFFFTFVLTHLVV